MTHQILYAARSDKGLIRSNNQDSVYAGDSLLVVADGMGGHAAGDMASRLVVGAFVPLDSRNAGGDLLRALAKATREGNSAIAEVVHRSPELDGMGTTVTALLFDGGRLGMAHVGDSRAYLYRDGVLHQLTHDDTFVQSLIDDGRITQEEASHHPQRSLLLRALNGTEVDPSLTIREVTAGDRYLICSDGLPGVVSAEVIAETLGSPQDPGATADALIQLALVGGGPDNITVIVADVIDTGAGTGPTPVAAPADPDATGPIGSYNSVRMTAEMPRVLLPPIPEDVPAKPEYLPADDDEDGTDPEFDDGSARSGPPDRRRSRRRRGALIAVAGVLVLAAVAIAGSFVWVRSQYYVGANNGEVVVYRGVDGSVLGLRLSSVQEGSCEPGLNGCLPLKVDDLVPAARAQVVTGIQAGTLDDARGVVVRLAGQMLPPCPEPVPTAPAQPTAGPTPTTGGASTAPSTSAFSTARPTTSGTPASGTPASGRFTGGRSTAAAPGDVGSGLIPGFGAAASRPLAPATTGPGTPATRGSGISAGATAGATGAASAPLLPGQSPASARAAASAPARGSAAPTGSPSSSPTTGSSATPLSTRAPEPGVTCRVVR